MTRICAFCAGASGAPLTREHVLPQWLDKALSTSETVVNWEAWWRESEEKKTEAEVRLMNPYDQKIKMICGTCNNGWMSDKVEGPVIEKLPQLIRLECAQLDPAAQKDIALWATKTAYVRSLMDKGESTIPAEHYSWLRSELAPPSWTGVWAIRSEPQGTTLRHFRFKGTTDGHGGYISALSLGQLVLLTVGFSSEIDSSLSNQIHVSIQSATRSSTIRLWPTSDSCKWPPADAMSKEDIEEIVPDIYSGILVNLSAPKRDTD